MRARRGAEAWLRPDPRGSRGGCDDSGSVSIAPAAPSERRSLMKSTPQIGRYRQTADWCHWRRTRPNGVQRAGMFALYSCLVPVKPAQDSFASTPRLHPDLKQIITTTTDILCVKGGGESISQLSACPRSSPFDGFARTLHAVPMYIFPLGIPQMKTFRIVASLAEMPLPAGLRYPLSLALDMRTSPTTSSSCCTPLGCWLSAACHSTARRAFPAAQPGRAPPTAAV